VSLQEGIAFAWLLVTGVGIGLTSSMMILTRSDLKLLKEHGIDGPVQSITRLSFWQEFRRFCVKVFLFSVGLEAVIAPQRDPRPYTASSWVFIGLLFTSVMLMNYSTFAAMRFRRRFLHEQEEIEGGAQ
jgi:uncharacterized membrane protein